MADFDDGKESGALRTIGEVGQALGIKPHVLRYWEQQFPMLEPLKRSGGRRYYRADDVALVERIDRLVNRDGYTLKGARAAIIGAPDPQAAAQVSSARSDTDDILPRLKAIRDRLDRALAA
ncbi:MerR family transcriptional regulator [Erythrobacter sp. QSSC1-22B]|uniref:MerR family transcriptional regulator n=1 Tax=Erythrobacter sp. QSSC1-22B TaxID=1860125 RepID=UPI0008048BB5|nr:MerR family transcriptional regulator [Erythrobacter sp. QSSC1-22B]OBX20717.1 MerR family transcriptional regulator [Erythrobacter sp. QSSC1-22B]